MDICKANHAEPCIKCMPGACGNRKTLDIPSPHVKPTKKSVGSLTVDVGINGIEETIKQLQTLKGLYTDIDTLQQRIIKGQEKIRVAQAYNVNIEIVDKQINADDFIKQFEGAVRSQYRAE